MAELPIDPADLPAEPATKIPGSDFVRGAAKMPAVRQLSLLFAIAGAVALAVAAVLWMRGDDLKPLMVIRSPEQAGEMIQVLEAAQISYRMDHRTSTLLVDAVASRMLNNVFARFLAPRAQCRFRNGSGVNPLCLSSINQPEIGGAWPQRCEPLTNCRQPFSRSVRSSAIMQLTRCGNRQPL